MTCGDNLAMWCRVCVMEALCHRVRLLVTLDSRSEGGPSVPRLWLTTGKTTERGTADKGRWPHSFFFSFTCAKLGWRLCVCIYTQVHTHIHTCAHAHFRELYWREPQTQTGGYRAAGAPVCFLCSHQSPPLWRENHSHDHTSCLHYAPAFFPLFSFFLQQHNASLSNRLFGWSRLWASSKGSILRALLWKRVFFLNFFWNAFPHVSYTQFVPETHNLRDD